MNQVLRQAWPERARGGVRPAVIAWRERSPRTAVRRRIAQWRARNWRRVVLAWFVLSLVIMAVASSVPAAGTLMRVAGGLTVAGVPVVLVALP